MSLADGKHFPNYMEMPARVPRSIWWVLRFATFAGTLGLIWVIVTQPQTGLDLFWKLVIPVLPLLFVVAPGLWRQVCPMAFANQIPRQLGFSRNLTLPLWAKNSAYLVAVLVFIAAVVMRPIVFNIQALALAGLIGGSVALAFAGGVMFKGRSGWCGTFCPLAPVQKAYGQAPLTVVKNGYCPSCVGCQKNCYDFNPRAAMHSDLADSDEWYRGHREFFAGALPGLIVGFFTAVGPDESGLWGYLVYMATGMAVSLGAFMALQRITRISRYRATLLFSMGALVLFYWFASPLLASGIEQFAGLSLPGPAPYIFFAAALLVAARAFSNGVDDELTFESLNARSEPRVGVELGRLRSAGAQAPSGDMVVDRGSGRSFAAEPGRSLLEGIESAGVKIDYGCRMGMCGADPIVVLEGAEHLSAPSATESETLERLGLSGRARMACVCRVARGGVTIDTKLDPRTLPEPEPELPTVDLAEETGIKRVVIIGNGAAGISAANEIRRLAPSCAIDIVAREKEHFYNRMAIARLLYGRTAMAGLFLQDPDWATRKKVTVWLNTAAMRIDRDAHELILGTGEKLPYDKLVLAQGSRALMPPIPGSDLPGCFVLREAGGAMEIRAWRQQHQCCSAVVVGGGVLGIETADALRRLNLTVTILQRTDRLMERQLDTKGSAILERYLAGLGIRVVTDVAGLTCHGDTRLETVQLADGEVMEAEIMVACAGIGPNTEIARDAGLDVERGVKVDRSMRSSDADIFAVGDVAELPGSISGLWAVSTAQGRVAAAALFGREASYSEPSTLVNLKMDGIDVKSYGLISASSPEQETIADPSEGEDEHRLLIVEGGRLLGAVFVGPPGTGRHVADLVEQKPDLTPILDDLRRGDWDALAKVVGAPQVAQAAE